MVSEVFGFITNPSKACYFLGTGSTGHGVALFVEVSALEMLRMGAGWDGGSC